MEIVPLINYIIAVLFVVCYGYQIFYMIVALIRKPKTGKKALPHRYAVMISARNEEAVIAQLIDSIKKQDYTLGDVDIFVAADNCTDNTAAVAQKAGATVYKRFNKSLVGKGYALEFLFDKVRQDKGTDYYDGYFIFDADNLLEPDYITEMNKSFSDGYRVVTGYRNSKNYGTNWVSSGYALWFMRESRHLNNPRALLGTSCAVSGTGFLIHRDVIERNEGWKYFLLTEDIEFTVDSILHGEKIGYCHSAMLYDEQPVTFSQSWTQRLRWAKGYLQVLQKYGKSLMGGIVKKRSFSCFDMTMNIMPAVVLTFFSLLFNAIMLIIGIAIHDGSLLILTRSVLEALANSYLFMFIVGIVTGITEWKKIKCSAPRKILSFITFPIFMLTYIPISITAFFKRVEWKPVHHTVSLSIENMTAETNK